MFDIHFLYSRIKWKRYEVVYAVGNKIGHFKIMNNSSSSGSTLMLEFRFNFFIWENINISLFSLGRILFILKNK